MAELIADMTDDELARRLSWLSDEEAGAVAEQDWSAVSDCDWEISAIVAEQQRRQKRQA